MSHSQTNRVPNAQRSRLNVMMLLSVITISACSDGEGFSAAPSTLSISSESGSLQPLEGTWFYCADNDPETDTGDRHFFTDDDFTYESYRYPSTDGSCTGQAMVTQYTNATITASDNFITSGWLDSTGAVALIPPANQAGTGLLAPNPEVTRLSLMVGNITPGSTANIVNTYYYMDDTADTWYLYRDDGPDDNADDYPDYVASYDPLRKESVIHTPLATTINAESGTMQLLDGYWQQECRSNGTNDYIEQHVIAGGSFTRQILSYTSNDVTCSLDETVITTHEGTVTAGENVTLLGWHNGTNQDTAPTAQSGNGLLTAPPTVTQLTIIIPSGTEAGTYYLHYYMDDTAATWCLYRDEGSSDITVTYNEFVGNFDPICKVSNP